MSLKIKEIFNKYSENIGGGISLLGSSVFAWNGNTEGMLITATFTAAELTLTKWGHTTKGYSAGAALFVVGDLGLAFSKAAEGNTVLQVSLGLMSAAWAIGAARYPAEKGWLGEYLQEKANILPAITGSTNLALRTPAIAASLGNGNIATTVALICWGINDVLSGRLQEQAVKAKQWIQEFRQS